MKRRIGRLLVGLVILAAGALRAGAADESYAIKLTRPSKVGDRYDTDCVLEINNTSTVTMPMGVPKVTTETIKGQLVGRVEVLEVDKKGIETSRVITVKKMVDGDGKELLKAGQEVKVQSDTKAANITLTGGTLSAEAEKMLAGMYGPSAPDAPTTDEQYGSGEKHKVGDSWPINAEMVAKGMAEAGMQIEARQLSGTTTLKAVETHNGIQALRIISQVMVKDATLPGPDPSLKIDSLNLQYEMTGVFPVDAALSMLEVGGKMMIDMRMSNPETGMKIEDKGQISTTAKLTPVKK